MIRIFKGSVFFLLSSIKLLILKLIYFKNVKVSILSFISPLTSIELTNKSKLSLGKKIKIRNGVKLHLRKSAEVDIGNNTFINYNSMIVSHEKIVIGKNVQIGPNVMLYDHDHDFRSSNGISDMSYKTSPIIIGDNVWIGANSVVLRGTVIGDNSVVGAGSTIKGEFEENSIILNKKEIIVIAQ